MKSNDKMQIENVSAAKPQTTNLVERPLAFGQGRDDAMTDLEILKKGGKKRVRVLLVPSAGCTAGLFAAMKNVGFMYLVDSNPAQIALSRLKMHLLRTAKPMERLKVLGHLEMEKDEREKILSEVFYKIGLPKNVLGPLDQVASVGPDYAGWDEEIFRGVRTEWSSSQTEIAALFQSKKVKNQKNGSEMSFAFASSIESAFERAMTPFHLKALFGERVFSQSGPLLARLFAERTRAVLANSRPASNPYLAQLFLGHFLDGVYAPWLDAPQPSRLPPMEWKNKALTEVLADVNGEFDFLFLSNALDGLGADEVEHHLDLAHRALRTGGMILFRALSPAFSPGLGASQFRWDTRAAAKLQERDRGFLFHQLFIGKK